MTLSSKISSKFNFDRAKLNFSKFHSNRPKSNSSKAHSDRLKFDFSKLNLRNWKYCPPSINTRSTQNPLTEKSTIFVCPKAGDESIAMSYSVDASHDGIVNEIHSRLHTCMLDQWGKLDKKRKKSNSAFSAPSTKRLTKSCKDKFATIFDSMIDTRNTGQHQNFLLQKNNASRFQYKTVSEDHYDTMNKIQSALDNTDLIGVIITPTENPKTLRKLVSKGQSPADYCILDERSSLQERQKTLEHLSARLHLERHKILESENPMADCDDFLNYKIPPESNDFSEFERVTMNKDAQRTFSSIMEKIPSFRSSYLDSYRNSLRNQPPQIYRGLSPRGTHNESNTATTMSASTEGE